MRGHAYPWHGRIVIPTFHPAAILRGGGESSRQFLEFRDDFELVRETLATLDAARPSPESVSDRSPRARRPCPRPNRRPRSSSSCSDHGHRDRDGDRRSNARGRTCPRHPAAAARHGVLTGDLGAGKTTLVQGIGRGLGVLEHVASPTFTLVREYTGRLDVVHVDVYRLERVQDVVDLGLDEMGGPGRVLLVEWGDAVRELLPEDRLRVQLTTDRADADDPPDRDRRRRGGPGRRGGRGWRPRWSPSGPSTETFRRVGRGDDRRRDRDLDAADLGGDRDGRARCSAWSPWRERLGRNP